jgi:hypothetical protein
LNLTLEIDSKNALKMHDKLVLALEQAARAVDLGTAERILRANAPASVWMVARGDHSLDLTLCLGCEKFLCARIVEGA